MNHPFQNIPKKSLLSFGVFLTLLLVFLVAATPIKDLKLQSNVDASGNTISNLAAPTNPADAATKGYVDLLATAGGVTNIFSTTANGLVPACSANLLKFLRGDGTWQYVTTNGLTSAVTSITAGSGLTGGTITSTGTLAVDSSVVRTNDSRLTDPRTPTTHNQAWSTITSTPTTLGGYGISDAVAANDSRLTNARTPTTHAHAWVDLTNVPAPLTTLAANNGSALTNLSASALTSGTISLSRLPQIPLTQMDTTGATTNKVVGYNGTNAAWVTAASGGGSSILSGRNRIINGAMRIDQRNAGSAVTPSSGLQYTVDRWRAVFSQSSKFTVQRNAGGVTPPAGFAYYLGATSQSSYAVTSGDYFVLQQSIESDNVTDFSFGVAAAKSITLSFWVRSSITGTHSGSLINNGSTRSYPFTFPISSANTWEQKSVTIPGDISGTWLMSGNGIGISVQFNLGSGSTYSGTDGSWASSNYTAATGAISLAGTSGATFYITGVQLEPGVVPTVFENIPVGQELALCQRYHEKSGSLTVAEYTARPLDSFVTVSSTAIGNSVIYARIPFKVTKRSAPSIVIYPETTPTNTSRASNDGAGDLSANSGVPNTVTTSGFGIQNGSGGTITTGGQLVIFVNWIADSEL